MEWYWPVDVVTAHVIVGMANGWENCCCDGVAKEEKRFEPRSMECERLHETNPHTSTDPRRRAGEEEWLGGGKLCDVELVMDGGVE